MKNRIFFIFILSVSNLFGQTITDTLAIQNFDSVAANPNWIFSGPVVYNSGFSTSVMSPPNSAIGINGSRAWETTTVSAGLTLEFDNVIIPPGYDSIRVSFHLAAFNLVSGSTGGPDNLDYVLTAYSLDGGTNYINRIRVKGSTTNNCTWPYNASGTAVQYYLPASETVFENNVSGLLPDGFAFVSITFPGSISQLRIKITARSSSSTDTWMIDDVVMTGENILTVQKEVLWQNQIKSWINNEGNLLINLSDGYSQSVKVGMYNSAGQIIDYPGWLNKGINTFTKEKLKPGLYFIVLQSEQSQTKVIKWLIEK